MWRGNLPGAKCFLFITNPFFIESSRNGHVLV